jgi:hypothetical protein
LYFVYTIDKKVVEMSLCTDFRAPLQQGGLVDDQRVELGRLDAAERLSSRR